MRNDTKNNIIKYGNISISKRYDIIISNTEN